MLSDWIKAPIILFLYCVIAPGLALLIKGNRRHAALGLRDAGLHDLVADQQDHAHARLDRLVSGSDERLRVRADGCDGDRPAYRFRPRAKAPVAVRRARHIPLSALHSLLADLDPQGAGKSLCPHGGMAFLKGDPCLPGRVSFHARGRGPARLPARAHGHAHCPDVCRPEDEIQGSHLPGHGLVRAPERPRHVVLYVRLRAPRGGHGAGEENGYAPVPDWVTSPRV